MVFQLVWAKCHRHPAWPAVVWTEGDACSMEVSGLAYKPHTLPMQFFGTYELARLRPNQVFRFDHGLHKSFHKDSKSRPRVKLQVISPTLNPISYHSFGINIRINIFIGASVAVAGS